jgi:enamidase
MARMVIRGLGLVFSGDMSRPLLDADSILVEDGRIAAIGHGLEAEQAIEAHGCAVMPG